MFNEKNKFTKVSKNRNQDLLICFFKSSHSQTYLIGFVLLGCNMYINNKINIADLPGYGYAKTSKIIREKLTDLIESYLCSRLNITRTFVLIDCKIGIKDSDIDIFDLIFSVNNNFCVVLTKIDKCSENFIIKQEKSIRSLMSNYKKNFDQIFLTSSKKNKGILDLQKIIYKLSTKNEI